MIAALMDIVEGETCRDEYESAARNYYEEAGDPEGASKISSMGKVPDNRCIGHFIGLQMAIVQLKSNANAA